MSPSKPPLADRLVSAPCCVCCPSTFASEFGDDMEETFRAQRTATRRERGSVALAQHVVGHHRRHRAHGAARALPACWRRTPATHCA